MFAAGIIINENESDLQIGMFSIKNYQSLFK